MFKVDGLESKWTVQRTKTGQSFEGKLNGPKDEIQPVFWDEKIPSKSERISSTKTGRLKRSNIPVFGK